MAVPSGGEHRHLVVAQGTTTAGERRRTRARRRARSDGVAGDPRCADRAAGAPAGAGRAALLGGPVREGDRDGDLATSRHGEVAPARRSRSPRPPAATGRGGSLMITEDDLRELIESAAAASPAVAPLRTELFTVEAPRRRRHRSYGPALGTLAAVVLAFGMVYWFAT